MGYLLHTTITNKRAKVKKWLGLDLCVQLNFLAGTENELLEPLLLALQVDNTAHLFGQRDF